MVFDHIRRMEKMGGSQRTEYENALKDASFTALLGKYALTRITGSSSLSVLFRCWRNGL